MGRHLKYEVALLQQAQVQAVGEAHKRGSSPALGKVSESFHEGRDN